jgi:hypothetical protein
MVEFLLMAELRLTGANQSKHGMSFSVAIATHYAEILRR